MTLLLRVFIPVFMLFTFGSTAPTQGVSAPFDVLPAPSPTASDGKLEKGKFLVAANHLQGSAFSQTVIYLVAYSRRGAMGVVVNRPTDVQLAQALPYLEDQPHQHDLIFAGGPVGRSRMLLVIRSHTFPLEEVLPVTDEIAVSASLDNLAILAEEATAQFHVYAGYSGWSPGQLDQEVARGDWHVMPGDPAMLFDTNLQNLWSTMLDKEDADGADWVHYRQPSGPLLEPSH